MENRTDQILKLRSKKYTYVQIGNIFNISRQRVHQLITEYRSFAASSQASKKIKEIGLKPGNLCELCGKQKDVIHHIDGDSKNNEYENLLPLCHWHHGLLHKYNRDKKPTLLLPLDKR